MYKMLIVDDERTERDCIRYLITSAGLPLELREAADAASALHILMNGRLIFFLPMYKCP